MQVSRHFNARGVLTRTRFIYNVPTGTMRTTERPLDFLFAAGLAATALAARWALTPWLGPVQPFAPGFVAIAASVLTLGWRPAVVTAALAYIGGTYLFIQPNGSVFQARPEAIAPLLTFTASAGLMIFMGHRARRAERELARANEQLREADRKKDAFLATLSHELRNPVGVIITAVATLEGREHDARTQTAIGVLSRQASQIRRLVDDLLDIGRITRGRLTLHAAPLDLRTCVEHAADGSRDAVTAKQQSLVVSVPPVPVQVHADHTRLVQVLSNLIDNASKYSPARAEIGVTVTDRGVDVTIEVTDDGPGIAPAVLPHVFDLFDQGTATSSSGGLGLGLGLCKHIVEMHGGTISASTNPRGKGASFLIQLPKERPRTSADTTPPAAGHV